jgi:hypothetical protein
MLKLSDLKVGDKVCYQPEHYEASGEFENGIVKEIPSFASDAGHAHYNSVRVVYNCAGNWNDYANYTSALTNLRDLKLGWE